MTKPGRKQGAGNSSARPPPARSAKDFFQLLMQDTQTQRKGFLAERERWLRSVQVEGREELVFEFEMLLRGIERYFNLHNLPIDKASGPLVARDFFQELMDVRDAIDQSIRIARRLLDPDSDQKMVFRRYVESLLADDRARRKLLEEELDQDTPQEALFVLRQSFEALRVLIDHLAKQESCPFGVFNEIGNLLLREIVLNQYFRPFRPLEFRIEYDRIKSVPVLEALQRLNTRDRRLFTVAFLALFRMLHYLSYIGEEETQAAPRRARVILALTRSEVATLTSYLKQELAPRVEDKRQRAAALASAKALADGHQRIVEEFLQGDIAETSPSDAALAFTSLVREHISLLARAVSPELGQMSVFHQLVVPTKLGERLRQDLFAFAQVCRYAEKELRNSDVKSSDAALVSLRAFIEYFHDVSYQLLRYGDYEVVDRFTAVVMELGPDELGRAARARLADDCKLFAEVVDTVFAQVSRRAELAARSFEAGQALEIARKFMEGVPKRQPG